MTTAHKLAHTIATLALVAMAVLQWNDPDPIFWSIAYLLPATAPLSRLLERRRPMLYATSNGVILAGLLISLPGFVDFVSAGDYTAISGEMTEAKPYIESGREFLGLILAAICHSLYWKWHLQGASDGRTPAPTRR